MVPYPGDSHIYHTEYTLDMGVLHKIVNCSNLITPDLSNLQMAYVTLYTKRGHSTQIINLPDGPCTIQVHV